MTLHSILSAAIQKEHQRNYLFFRPDDFARVAIESMCRHFAVEEIETALPCPTALIDQMEEALKAAKQYAVGFEGTYPMVVDALAAVRAWREGSA